MLWDDAQSHRAIRVALTQYETAINKMRCRDRGLRP